MWHSKAEHHVCWALHQILLPLTEMGGAGGFVPLKKGGGGQAGVCKGCGI